jgi:hypothetical protein
MRSLRLDRRSVVTATEHQAPDMEAKVVMVIDKLPTDPAPMVAMVATLILQPLRPLSVLS